MSITVEKQMLHETKGDTVAPGAEGLLNLRPDDFVFYVGGYPSSFMVSLAGRAALHSRLSKSCSLSGCTLRPSLGSVLGGEEP